MAARAVTDGTNENPYVGNRPFLTTDAYRFHGRSSEAREVAARWRDNQITFLSGPSGVGKTSLIQAGVIPLLASVGADLLPVGRLYHGTAFPVAALPEHNPYTLALLTTWSPGEPQTRLSGLTAYDFLRRRQLRAGPDGRPSPVLAVIDQVERLFDGPGRRDRHRGPFIDGLAEVLRELPHIHLLLSIRDDYGEDIERYQSLLGLSARAGVLLRRLNVEEAVEAVRNPLAGTGRWFSAGTAEGIVESLRTTVLTAEDGQPRTVLSEDVEPTLLQAVCAELWTSLPVEAAEITAGQVTRLADTDQALDRFCDQAITAVAADHGISPGQLSSWVNRHFITELGTRGTAYEGMSDTAGMPNAVARALRDRHVLTAVWRSGTRWYELLHDRFIGPVRRLADRLPPASPESQASPSESLRAAQLAIADGDLELAATLAAAALRSAADLNLRLCADAESLLGNIAYMRRQFAEAEVRYRAAAALFETLRDARAVAGLLAAVGQTLLSQERYGQAVECLHAAVGRIPNDLTVQTELAWALWHAGQQRAAVAVLTGVLAIDGEAEDARRARGEILADLGDAEDALRDLDRVRRYQQPSTRAARALALAMLSRSGAADPEIDAALSGAPGNGPVLLYAARVAALEHDPVGAAELARRAVDATDPAVPPHQRRQALQLMETIA
jgi:tetratricopeptide (TPR) repeat protein